jgi:hypothetical protein
MSLFGPDIVLSNQPQQLQNVHAMTVILLW